MVMIDYGFIFANTQPFSHSVWTEWVRHVQVCLEDMCNLPHFTILSLSYL